MGLFKRSKEPKVPPRVAEWRALQERDIDLRPRDLENLLETSAGDYLRRPPPSLIQDAKNAFAKLPKDELDEKGHFNGVAFLSKGQDNGYDVVWVSIRNRKVSKLTKEAVASIWEKMDAPIPVRCHFRNFYGGELPSLDLSTDK